MQLADCALTAQGTIQLFWFDDPHHNASVEVIPGTFGEPPSSGGWRPWPAASPAPTAL